MKYVVHRRYKSIGTCGEYFNFKPGTVLETIGRFISKDNKAVCAIHSEDAHRHFSRDDDGKGAERGALTYAIAYAPRGDGFRFTDEEQDMLRKEYSHFLVKDQDVILFNDDFFNSAIPELKTLYKRIGGK